MTDSNSSADKHPLRIQYDATRQQYLDRVKRNHIENVNNRRDCSLHTIRDIRMHRFYIMEEAGQPTLDIKPDEQSELDHMTSSQKRKAILGQSGVLNYLRPFYENAWNRRLDMSEKRVKHYVKAILP